MLIKELAKKRECLKDICIIDAHAHLGRLNEFYLPEASLKEVIGLMDITGIDRILATHLECLYTDIVSGNEKLYKAILEYPERISGYCTVNPWNREEMVAELQKYLGRPGIIGIKIHPSMHDCHIGDKNYDLVWEYADAYNALVLAHTWEEGDTCKPADLDGILRRYKRMTMILGHSGGTYQGYRQSIDLVNRYENAYMEICGCEFSCTWLSELLRCVDYKRVLFGTDQVFHDPRYLLGRVVYSEIPEEAKIAILGGNILKLLARNKPVWGGG